MRKVIIPVLILAIAGFAAYHFLWKKDPETPENKPKPLPVAENTGVFNQSFAKMLNSYYALRDALTDGDLSKASTAGSELVTTSDSLKTSEIQGDSTGVIKETAKSYAQTINGSAKAVVLEKDLDGKRKEFSTISEAIFNLVRTVKYSGEKVYWLYCPMAFNNKGANWMSEDTSVKNPYMGKDMTSCGSVQDSLDYSKK